MLFAEAGRLMDHGLFGLSENQQHCSMKGISALFPNPMGGSQRLILPYPPVQHTEPAGKLSLCYRFPYYYLFHAQTLSYKPCSSRDSSWNMVSSGFFRNPPRYVQAWSASESSGELRLSVHQLQQVKPVAGLVIALFHLRALVLGFSVRRGCWARSVRHLNVAQLRSEMEGSSSFPWTRRGERKREEIEERVRLFAVRAL